MHARRTLGWAHSSLLLLACAFALGLTGSTESAAGASAPTLGGRVGLSSHLVWVSEEESRPQFEQARAGGIEWVREDFLWESIEPSRGRFDWTRTDGLMASTARAGVNVLAILGYSAPWAASGPSSVYPPTDVNDYARYAAAVVARYGPGGSFWVSRPDLPARPLAAVELWNEPWGHWFWKPNPNPAAYAALARAAATAIRFTNPGVKILLAGELLQARTDGKIVDWLAAVLAADPGLPALVDAYASHPYPHPFARGPYDDRADQGYRWDFRRVSLIRQVAEARGAAKPVWITELGWSTATDHPDGVSEQQQATFVRQAAERALGEWGGFVERIFFYQWDRSNGIMSDHEGNYGLRRADGSEKPAWGALKTLIGPTPPPQGAPTAPIKTTTGAGTVPSPPRATNAQAPESPPPVSTQLPPPAETGTPAGTTSSRPTALKKHVAGRYLSPANPRLRARLRVNARARG